MKATSGSFVACDRIAQRKIDIGVEGDARDATLLIVQAGGVELDAPEAHRLHLHLGLPLVDLRQRLRRQRGEEALRPHRDQTGLRLPEFGRAEPFGAGGGDDQRAARLQDVERRHHAFHRLVVGLVQRVAGGRT